MADQPEPLEPIYPDGIYQLEKTDPVLGGAYNAATGEGIDNLPLMQLAQRTAWLKWALHGLGGELAEVADLDALDKTQPFYFSSNAVGAPNSNYDGRGWHLQSDGEATQIVVNTSSQMHFRDWDTQGGSWGPWRLLLTDASATNSFYSVADAPDAWLIGENFNGDTAVSLGAVSGHCTRIGNIANIALSLEFTNFSMPASSDGTISTNININAIGVAAGWFAQLDSSGIGVAYGALAGTSWDAPWMSFYHSANGTAGTLWISTGDTQDIPAQSGDAIKLTLKTNITLLVKD